MVSKFAFLYRSGTIVLALALFLLLPSCNDGLEESLMVGRWQAVQLVDQQKEEVIEMDLSPVHFEFFPDERYHFQSTLNLSEAGRYYTIGQLLYTTDTTATEPLEKAVRIVQLTPDSLAFLMVDQGVEKHLQLIRKK